MKHRNSKNHATTGLTTIEEETAGLTPVWVVWWEDPDKSWESLCLSLAESDREVEARHADHLIQH